MPRHPWLRAAARSSYQGVASSFKRDSALRGRIFRELGFPMTMRFVSVFAVILLAWTLVGCGPSGSSPSPPSPPPVGGNAVVDFGSSQQTIRGFGGSSAWITNLTTAQADALYGNGGSQQIGLSILRVRIDPGGAVNWGIELNNAQQAASRGASVIATPWTPPAAMKSNNHVVGGTLNTGNYGDYANYLESFVTYMQSGGVSLYGISMQNEPDAVVTYESCSWTPAQMDTWVANNSSVLTTRLIMPESESFNTSYSDPALNDANAVDHIAIIAGHTYGTAPFRHTHAENDGKDVWMTEHSFSDTGIAGALKLAKEVHDSMTVANYNAYLWWWLQNWTGGNYLNGLLDEQNNLTLNGYALGQFAKFIRPGYLRSDATSNPSANVYVSAYEGSGHYVIVAINLGATDVNQPFVIQNQIITSMTPYRTSATDNLAELSLVPVTDDSFTYTLPAQTITTFVE